MKFFIVVANDANLFTLVQDYDTPFQIPGNIFFRNFYYV